jgi:hypothetical protein
LGGILNIVGNLRSVFKSSGVVGLIYVTFVKAGFLLKLILNGKSKVDLEGSEFEGKPYSLIVLALS